MTDPNYALLVMIVDRSGSMDAIREEAENLIERVVTEQINVPGRCDIEIVQFDDVIETAVPRQPITGDFTYKLVPRGMTALHDAMGLTIKRVGEELAALPEDQRPGNVLVAIMTDGLENRSREYKGNDVKRLVTEQTDRYGWKFTFLGANQNAVFTAKNLGISGESALTFAPSVVGMAATQDSLSNYVGSSMRGQSASYSDEDRKRAMGGSET